jgi:hypothetical protein
MVDISSFSLPVIFLMQLLETYVLKAVQTITFFGFTEEQRN